MKFRTEYIPENRAVTLSPEHPVILLGSCFADNMASMMRSSMWNAVNPTGALYNPLSISRVIKILLSETDFVQTINESMFESMGIFHSWLFDSRFSSDSRRQLRDRIMSMRETVVEIMNKSQVLFVTFGTAWCYYFAEDKNFLVANCHKQPSSLFERRRLSVSDIVESWRGTLSLIREKYPNLQVIFTVSPVRHLKDGFEGNSRSKSILLLAVEELCLIHENCHYFPAYEIMTDDLRDYRFYSSDLVHPSQEAVEYIWEIFKTTYLDREGMELVSQGERLLRAWNHRPLLRGEAGGFLEDRENERRQKLYAEYNTFISAHPGMLRLDTMCEMES